MYHGSQSIWPNDKALHTHTNTPNLPASSVSPSEGVCSHGGALPLPEAQVGRSQGIMLKIFPPGTKIVQLPDGSDRRGGGKLKRGMR